MSALEDASTYAVWYQLLLSDLGVSARPITVCQDNKSTIIMAVKGASFKRTKHLIGRHSYVKERIANGDIVLKYVPTKEMMADLLTKPVSKEVLTRLLKLLHVVKLK